MYEIDRTDFNILTSFKFNDEGHIIFLDKPTDGITITEIMEYLRSEKCCKSRKTIYLHLSKLVQKKYVAKGIINNHADTYFIADKGKDALKGDL